MPSRGGGGGGPRCGESGYIYMALCGTDNLLYWCCKLYIGGGGGGGGGGGQSLNHYLKFESSNMIKSVEEYTVLFSTTIIESDGRF